MASDSERMEVEEKPNYSQMDFCLRLFFLFATSLTALLLVATSKQSKMIPVAVSPLTGSHVLVSRTAKFNHAPALIYLISSSAVTCFYSVVTMVISASAISKPSPSSRTIFHLALLDALMLGVMASATGSAGSVAYIGLKGDKYVNWRKICDLYGKFCRHIGSSVVVSMVASATLVMLIVLSSYKLYCRSR